jgi:hypothetical protein
MLPKSSKTQKVDKTDRLIPDIWVEVLDYMTVQELARFMVLCKFTIVYFKSTIHKKIAFKATLRFYKKSYSAVRHFYLTNIIYERACYNIWNVQGQLWICHKNTKFMGVFIANDCQEFEPITHIMAKKVMQGFEIKMMRYEGLVFLLHCERQRSKSPMIDLLMCSVLGTLKTLHLPLQFLLSILVY